MGWSGGTFHDYSREYGIDLVQLSAFLRGTQPEAVEALALPEDRPARSFAIIIDEAHSSQGGRTSAAMTQALSEAGEEGDLRGSGQPCDGLASCYPVSYFASTSTAKNKTLEIFGTPDPQPDGTVRHRAFHSYTMKQAIQEGGILDVLAHYTPVANYFKLAKTVEDDPEFDTRKAQRKLRRFVEGSNHAIRLKAEIMVDHFHDQVLAQNKIGGAARAMVVTNGIERAIQYYHAIRGLVGAGVAVGQTGELHGIAAGRLVAERGGCGRRIPPIPRWSLVADGGPHTTRPERVRHDPVWFEDALGHLG